MNRERVNQIYNLNKKDLLFDIKPYNDKLPIAILLGGQPASGKGAIVNIMHNEYSNREFLNVNGDNYRQYHPDYCNLALNDVEKFSEKTQIFSNVFTENLINDATINKLDIIIEGTMRNSTITTNTAELLKKRGYNIEAHIVAMHPMLSELNIYNRYAEELIKLKPGRLADVNSHNKAVMGLCETVDDIYKYRLTNKICIYIPVNKTNSNSYYLKRKETYNFINNNWDKELLPSMVIKKLRNLQENDQSLFLKFKDKGKYYLDLIKDESIKKSFSNSLMKVESIINSQIKFGRSR